MPSSPLYLDVLVAIPAQREQEWTDCSFQNKNTLHCHYFCHAFILAWNQQESMKSRLCSLITATTGQNTVQLLWSGCQYLWYQNTSHASFVVGKSYAAWLKSSSRYDSSCKVLVWLLLRAFSVYLLYSKGGFLLLVFAKSIFHFYSKNYTDVGRTLQTLLADAKWCVCKSYCCSKLSFKCYWIPLLSSKYLGETPVNSDDRLNHSFMKVANPLEMSCVFLQYILFLPSLSDDNAFGCVFKTKVF